MIDLVTSVDALFSYMGATIFVLGLLFCLIPRTFRFGIFAMLAGDVPLAVAIAFPRKIIAILLENGIKPEQFPDPQTGHVYGIALGVAFVTILFILRLILLKIFSFGRKKEDDDDAPVLSVDDSFLDDEAEAKSKKGNRGKKGNKRASSRHLSADDVPLSFSSEEDAFKPLKENNAYPKPSTNANTDAGNNFASAALQGLSADDGPDFSNDFLAATARKDAEVAAAKAASSDANTIASQTKDASGDADKAGLADRMSRLSSLALSMAKEQEQQQDEAIAAKSGADAAAAAGAGSAPRGAAASPWSGLMAKIDAANAQQAKGGNAAVQEKASVSAELEQMPLAGRKVSQLLDVIDNEDSEAVASLAQAANKPLREETTTAGFADILNSATKRQSRIEQENNAPFDSHALTDALGEQSEDLIDDHFASEVQEESPIYPNFKRKTVAEVLASLEQEESTNHSDLAHDPEIKSSDDGIQEAKIIASDEEVYDHSEIAKKAPDEKGLDEDTLNDEFDSEERALSEALAKHEEEDKEVAPKSNSDEDLNLDSLNFSFSIYNQNLMEKQQEKAKQRLAAQQEAAVKESDESADVTHENSDVIAPESKDEFSKLSLDGIDPDAENVSKEEITAELQKQDKEHDILEKSDRAADALNQVSLLEGDFEDEASRFYEYNTARDDSAQEEAKSLAERMRRGIQEKFGIDGSTISPALANDPGMISDLERQQKVLEALNKLKNINAAKQAAKSDGEADKDTLDATKADISAAKDDASSEPSKAVPAESREVQETATANASASPPHEAESAPADKAASDATDVQTKTEKANGVPSDNGVKSMVAAAKAAAAAADEKAIEVEEPQTHASDAKAIEAEEPQTQASDAKAEAQPQAAALGPTSDLKAMVAAAKAAAAAADGKANEADETIEAKADPVKTEANSQTTASSPASDLKAMVAAAKAAAAAAVGGLTSDGAPSAENAEPAPAEPKAEAATAETKPQADGDATKAQVAPTNDLKAMVAAAKAAAAAADKSENDEPAPEAKEALTAGQASAAPAANDLKAMVAAAKAAAAAAKGGDGAANGSAASPASGGAMSPAQMVAQAKLAALRAGKGDKAKPKNVFGALNQDGTSRVKGPRTAAEALKMAFANAGSEGRGLLQNAYKHHKEFKPLNSQGEGGVAASIKAEVAKAKAAASGGRINELDLVEDITAMAAAAAALPGSEFDTNELLAAVDNIDSGGGQNRVTDEFADLGFDASDFEINEDISSASDDFAVVTPVLPNDGEQPADLAASIRDAVNTAKVKAAADTRADQPEDDEWAFPDFDMPEPTRKITVVNPGGDPKVKALRANAIARLNKAREEARARSAASAVAEAWKKDNVTLRSTHGIANKAAAASQSRTAGSLIAQAFEERTGLVVPEKMIRRVPDSLPTAIRSPMAFAAGAKRINRLENVQKAAVATGFDIPAPELKPAQPKPVEKTDTVTKAELKSQAPEITSDVRSAIEANRAFVKSRDDAKKHLNNKSDPDEVKSALEAARAAARARAREAAKARATIAAHANKQNNVPEVERTEPSAAVSNSLAAARNAAQAVLARADRSGQTLPVQESKAVATPNSASLLAGDAVPKTDQSIARLTKAVAAASHAQPMATKAATASSAVAAKPAVTSAPIKAPAASAAAKTAATPSAKISVTKPAIAPSAKPVAPVVRTNSAAGQPKPTAAAPAPAQAPAAAPSSKAAPAKAKAAAATDVKAMVAAAKAAAAKAQAVVAKPAVASSAKGAPASAVSNDAVTKTSAAKAVPATAVAPAAVQSARAPVVPNVAATSAAQVASATTASSPAPTSAVVAKAVPAAAPDAASVATAVQTAAPNAAAVATAAQTAAPNAAVVAKAVPAAAPAATAGHAAVQGVEGEQRRRLHSLKSRLRGKPHEAEGTADASLKARKVGSLKRTVRPHSTDAHS